MISGARVNLLVNSKVIEINRILPPVIKSTLVRKNYLGIPYDRTNLNNVFI